MYKLPLNTAIQIRNKFNYLVGKTNPKMSAFKIRDIVVGPYYSEVLNEFNKTLITKGLFLGGKDDELAQSYNPDSYCVYVHYFDIGGAFSFDNIFNTLNDLQIQINLSDYGIEA